MEMYSLAGAKASEGRSCFLPSMMKGLEIICRSYMSTTWKPGSTKDPRLSPKVRPPYFLYFFETPVLVAPLSSLLLSKSNPPVAGRLRDNAGGNGRKQFQWVVDQFQ